MAKSLAFALGLAALLGVQPLNAQSGGDAGAAGAAGSAGGGGGMGAAPDRGGTGGVGGAVDPGGGIGGRSGARRDFGCSCRLTGHPSPPPALWELVAVLALARRRPRRSAGGRASHVAAERRAC